MFESVIVARFSFFFPSRFRGFIAFMKCSRKWIKLTFGPRLRILRGIKYISSAVRIAIFLETTRKTISYTLFRFFFFIPLKMNYVICFYVFALYTKHINYLNGVWFLPPTVIDINDTEFSWTIQLPTSAKTRMITKQKNNTSIDVWWKMVNVK